MENSKIRYYNLIRRHEWYQSDSYVIINVFIKDVKNENIKIDFQEKSLSITIKLDAGLEYNLELDPLTQEIDIKQSKYTILSKKVEILLKKKVNGVKWNDLESEDLNMATMTTIDSQKASLYPTSNKNKVNWDALVNKELEGEKEDDINDVFKKIYQTSDEDTRKAMIKSFTESNGTCLSTNWKDVKNRKVETSPPDGMEAKKY